MQEKHSKFSEMNYLCLKSHLEIQIKKQKNKLLLPESNLENHKQECSSSTFVHDQHHNRNRKANLNWFGTVFEQHSAELVLPFDRSAAVIPASASSRNRRAFRQLRRSGFASVDPREPGRRRGGWRSRRWRRRWSRCRRRRRSSGRRGHRESHLRAAVFRFEGKF